MRLFIIGNGFDLYHGLKTSFADYHRFLIENYPKTLESIQCSKYFDGCGIDIFDEHNVFWTDVERHLKFNYDLMLEETVDEYYPPNLLEKSDARWHRVEFDADEKAKKIDNSFTNEALIQWMKSIDVLMCNQTKKFSFGSEDYFVSFNYTETLEDVYGVESTRILHIHGCISNPKSLQFGNPDQTSRIIREKFEMDYGDKDFYEMTIKPAEEKYLIIADSMSKDLDENIPILRSFLKNKIFENVTIMGHSFMGVDKPYYDKVLIPMYSKLDWTIFAHGDDAVKNAETFFARYGINGTAIKW